MPVWLKTYFTVLLLVICAVPAVLFAPDFGLLTEAVSGFVIRAVLGPCLVLCGGVIVALAFYLIWFAEE